MSSNVPTADATTLLPANRATPAQQGSRLLAPGPDEVEVSLFGPGCGESILVHLGRDRWLMVDSCTRDDGALPAALEYLRDIGSDPARSVRYLIATHWHDDHVRGFARAVQECEQARVYITAALTVTSLLTLVQSDALGDRLDEMRRTIRLVDGEGSWRQPGEDWDMVGQDAALDVPEWHQDGPEVAIWALSPSARDKRHAARHLGQLLGRDSRYTGEVPEQKENDTSVVVHVRVGQQSILLGADRERRGDASRGWGSVRSCWTRRQLPPSSLYKVAHHGSPNAEDPVVWDVLLVPRPECVVAPFNRGNDGGRPRSTDLARVCTKAGRLLLSSVGDVEPPPPLSEEHDLLEASGVQQEWVEPPLGHVRLRANSAGGPWRPGRVVSPAATICVAAEPEPRQLPDPAAQQP